MSILERWPSGLKLDDIWLEIDSETVSLHSVKVGLGRLLKAGQVLRKLDESTAGCPAIYWHPMYRASWQTWKPPAKAPPPAPPRPWEPYRAEVRFADLGPGRYPDMGETATQRRLR